ncbi:hypothetical protein V1519DRAFT_120431 [Lipomyces tetrasporus]
MISALYENLERKYGDSVSFRGLDSYVRCLAHILNLILQGILHALKSGNAREACAMCDSLSNREACSFEDQGALFGTRIYSLTDLVARTEPSFYNYQISIMRIIHALWHKHPGWVRHQRRILSTDLGPGTRLSISEITGFNFGQ